VQCSVAATAATAAVTSAIRGKKKWFLIPLCISILFSCVPSVSHFPGYATKHQLSTEMQLPVVPPSSRFLSHSTNVVGEKHEREKI
jgi:hypothetical protein